MDHGKDKQFYLIGEIRHDLCLALGMFSSILDNAVKRIEGQYKLPPLLVGYTSNMYLRGVLFLGIQEFHSASIHRFKQATALLERAKKESKHQKGVSPNGTHIYSYMAILPLQ